MLVIVQATISGGSGLRVISDEPNYGGVESLGFRVQDLGFIGFRVQGLGLGLGFRICRVRVQGLGLGFRIYRVRV